MNKDVIITVHQAVRLIWRAGKHISGYCVGLGWLLDLAFPRARSPAYQLNMDFCAEFPRETLLPTPSPPPVFL